METPTSLPQDKDELGRMATALLTNPLLRDAFEAAARKHHRDWELAAPDDFDTQRTAHLSLLALRNVHIEIQKHIQNAALGTQANPTKYADRVAQKIQATRK